MIRLAIKTDAEQILQIYAPYVEKTTISLETTVPSAEEMEKRIKVIAEIYPWLVYEENGSIAGYAYASKHRERAAYGWTVEVSAYVKENMRGKGVGRALYSVLIDLLKYQGYINAYAIIGLPNEASVGIHESFGFEKVAHFGGIGYKLGQWCDTGCWALKLRQEPAQPEEPRALNTIEKTVLKEMFEEQNQRLGLKND